MNSAWCRILVFVALSLSQFKGVSADQDFRLAWFAQLNPEHSFWAQHLAFTQAAASDLNVELDTYFAMGDQIRYRQQLQQVVAGAATDAVDGMIIINMKQQDLAVLDALKAGEIPAISNVNPMDFNLTGLPRENLAQWIGEVVTDENNSGYQLAERLIAQARAQKLVAGDGKLHMLAIGGTASDGVAQRRIEGLNRALAGHPDVHLAQLFHTSDWSAKEAELIALTALRRYPQTSIIWSANDDIALGVIRAAGRLGLLAGKQVLTGGIDGTLALMEKIKTGQAVCSVSGLFMQGGWAVVLLHDYLHGKDFYPVTSAVIEVTGDVIDQSQADAYLAAFGDGNWDKIDFTRFSRRYVESDNPYDFTIRALLEQLEQP